MIRKDNTDQQLVKWKSGHGLRLKALIVLFIFASSGAAINKTVKTTPSLFGLSSWKPVSAQSCSKCHPNHYEMWTGSMHAFSAEDPIFKASLMQAQVVGGEPIRDYCLGCHTPLAKNMRDYSLTQEVTREGVTCDFCHSIEDVHLDRQGNEYDLNIGSVKYGPSPSVETPAHESQKSDLFGKSEICGGCHELVNDNGVTVMGTYSEWKAGPYPDLGIQCQNCHMPMSLKAASINANGDTLNKLAHDHRFQGGHSQVNLRNAATITLNSEIIEKTAQISVFITNAESGHKLPTGMPGRKLLLEVTILDQDGNLLAQPSRVYRKVLVDDEGTILEGNVNQLIYSAGIYNDNRIGPKETKKEEFLVDLPDGVKEIEVLARLTYEYESPVMYIQKIQAEMVQARETYRLKGWKAVQPKEVKIISRIAFVTLAALALYGLFFLYSTWRKRQTD